MFPELPPSEGFLFTKSANPISYIVSYTMSYLISYPNFHPIFPLNVLFHGVGPDDYDRSSDSLAPVLAVVRVELGER